MTTPGGVRVIGGMFRGRRLKTLSGDAVRPTGDKVREAFFDLLGPKVLGSSFLDAYAGTGAVGIEALSRGAAEVTFVERFPQALRILRENLDRIIAPSGSSRADAGIPAAGGAVRVESADLLDAIRALEKRGCAFDVLFVDPPYGGMELERAMRLLSRSRLIADGAVVVAEHGVRDHLPACDPLVPIRTKVYGRTSLTFFQLRV